jgi:glycosyltransferase involved in cell wall biosynthesis
MSSDEQLATHDELGSAIARESDIALAFVGQVVADKETFQKPAFSQAGQMFQENLLVGLKHAGIAPSVIISAFPIRAFPYSRCLFYGGADQTISLGMRVTQVPFVNITPLKEISIGLATLWLLIRWGLRCKGKRRVVFTYNLTVPPGIFTLLGAWLIRAKSVVAIYDINVPGHTVQNSLWRRIDYRLQRWLLPRCDGHVSAADGIMQEFAPNRHYLLLEGGVSQNTLERFRSAPKKDMADGTFTIVAGGTLNEGHGIPEILKAFSMINGDSYRLFITGDGPLREVVENAAAQDCRIRYFGYLKFGEVLDLYSQASVLISMLITKKLNTKYFFPSKIMEYLASGVPVVSTYTGNLEKDYNGLLYLLRDESAEGLADLLRQISQSDIEERCEMARRAADFMAHCKTWDAQGQKVANYISKQVLES